MSHSARTVTLTESAEALLRELRLHTGEQPGALLSAAMETYARTRLTGLEWIGHGVWSGFSLSRSHTASKHGRPVLVAPDGRAFEPGDLLLALNVLKGE